MTNLNSAKFGRGPGKPVESAAGSSGAHAENNDGRPTNPKHHALLTESDVLILTVASIAMALMTFIIMTVCLFKYKLDRSSSFDEEQILSTHSKMVMSRALFTTAATSGNSNGTNSSGQSNGDNSGGSSKQSSSRSKSKGTKRTGNSGKSHTSDKFLQAAISKHHLQQTHPHLLAASTSFSHRHQYPPLVAAGHPAASSLFAPVTQNFLMRSPTIRRMQGLAGNASDWFKYTLRAYPSSRGSRRRRLFLQSSAVCGGGPSQLTTVKLKSATLQPVSSENQLQNRHEILLAHSLNSLKLSGCPQHAFKCLEDGSRQDECLYCASLLATSQKRDSTRKSSGNQKEEMAKKMRATTAQGQSSSSSSSSSSGAATVKIQQKTTTSNFQQTIADKQQSGGSFMSPKMIQALAQQLDQEQASQQQASKPLLLSGRPSNSRPMKTFGNTQQASTDSLPTDSASDSQAKVASQIPTIDVEGRFAYQSDISHLDSPRARNEGRGARQLAASGMTRDGSYQQQRDSTTSGELSRFADESRLNTRSGGRATPASTVATNQEDIFILVRDTPTSETTTTTGATRYDDARSQMTTSTTNTIHNEQTTSNQEQDQCSRTSSPIAYGFMRSSPSATTLSSTNPSHQASQYVVNRSPPPVSSLEGPSLVALGHYSSRQSASRGRPHSLAVSEQRFQQYSSNSSFKGKTAGNRPPIRTAPDSTIDSNNNNNNNDNDNNDNSSGGGYVNAILKQFQSIGQKQGSAAAANVASWTNVTPRPQQSASKTLRQEEDHEDQMIISRL